MPPWGTSIVPYMFAWSRIHNNYDLCKWKHSPKLLQPSSDLWVIVIILYVIWSFLLPTSSLLSSFLPSLLPSFSLPFLCQTAVLFFHVKMYGCLPHVGFSLWKNTTRNPLINNASTTKLFFVCLDELRRHIHREREAREKAERQCAALQRGKGENFSLLNAIHFF